MIRGIGIDVVEVPRMQRTIDVWGETFLRKVFTDREIDYARSKKKPTDHIAARFAAKEAVAKALSTGWSSGFRWKDIEVQNDKRGQPNVVLYGKTLELVQGSTVRMSISHSEHVVVAVAIIEN
jgi:holo-[acyl-carrier protein] synthase